jgi:hypothetical protein
VTERNQKRAVLERELTEALAKLPEPMRDMAIDRVAELIHSVRESERTRCVKLCRARAQLWRTTRMHSGDSPRAAQEEARARANEADFLADALEAPTEEADELDA